MDIFVVTSIGYANEGDLCGRCRCSNVWLTEEDAKESVLTNHFDVWEGYTNQYVLIEKMEVGAPWTCEQVAWFKCERIVQEDKSSKYFVHETDKPKEWEGICNLGIG